MFVVNWKHTLLSQSTNKGAEIHTHWFVFDSVRRCTVSFFVIVLCRLCWITLGWKCVLVFLWCCFFNAPTLQVDWIIGWPLWFIAVCMCREEDRHHQQEYLVNRNPTKNNDLYGRPANTLPCVCVSVCVWICIFYCISPVCGHLSILKKQKKKMRDERKGRGEIRMKGAAGLCYALCHFSFLCFIRRRNKWAAAGGIGGIWKVAVGGVWARSGEQQ